MGAGALTVPVTIWCSPPPLGSITYRPVCVVAATHLPSAVHVAVNAAMSDTFLSPPAEMVVIHTEELLVIGVYTTFVPSGDTRAVTTSADVGITPTWPVVTSTIRRRRSWALGPAGWKTIDPLSGVHCTLLAKSALVTALA